MRQVALVCVLAALVVVVAGCGGGGKEAETDTQATGAAKAACEGSALAAPSKLPPNFPQVQGVTYTKESTEGPTDVTEGHFKGSVEEAHDAFKTALNTGGYTVTHDELDEHDSEVNWQGHGRSGQVALREQCGEGDKIYVHVTNRPA